MHDPRLDDFVAAHSRAADRFVRLARGAGLPVTVVHHNDADGLAGAAALAHALAGRHSAGACRPAIRRMQADRPAVADAHEQQAA